MHIGDFAYPRSDFKVWCADHVDVATSGAVVFENVEDGPFPEWDDPSHKKGWRCAILGPEVGGTGDNLPNCAVRQSETLVP
jgi:hypothetical protein